ncbi:unnamed protein product, partial [Iphiclides podalirius]
MREVLTSVVEKEAGDKVTMACPPFEMAAQDGETVTIRHTLANAYALQSSSTVRKPGRNRKNAPRRKSRRLIIDSIYSGKLSNLVCYRRSRRD